MSETALSREIQDALESIGAVVVRIQSGTFRGAGGHMVRGADKGTPDLAVIWRGRTQWFEVKTREGELSHEQDSWHRNARQQGARVFTVRSAEQALRIVMKGGDE
jgi:hypothetical protein